MPGYYRAKVVNELRSTHFHMGKGKNEFSTTNKADFKGAASEAVQIVSHNNVSHIKISSDDQGMFSTESGAKYRSYTEEARSKPKKPEPAIKVSQSPGVYVTTALKAYQDVKTEPLGNKIFQETKKNARKHNFQFGEGDKICYKTAMQSDYFYQEGFKGNLTTDKDIKQKFTKNPEFNEKQGSYISTNYQEYKTLKPLTPIKAKRNAEITSFKLENTPQSLVTVTQTSYSPKKAADATLSPTKITDLKSSHFSLGETQAQYTLSSYQAPLSPSKADDSKNRSLSPPGIKFGTDPSNFHSNYYSSFSTRPNSELTYVSHSKKSDYLSSVNLGEESPSLISQSHSAHKYLSTSPGRLPAETEKNLRTHHFTLGSDQKNFKQSSKDYGVPSGYFKAVDLKERSSRMKKTNWGFGNYPTQMVSEVKKEFGFKGGEKIPYRTDGRKSHFEIGGDSGKWQSSYNGNFHWIKPVPDTDYKFTVMN